MLGSWETVVDLIGQKVLLATIIVTVAMILIGRLAARGTEETRDAAGLIQCCTNSGPAFAAVAIAFDGDPEILAIITALLLVQIAIGLVTASYLGRNRPTPAAGPTLGTA